MMPPSPSPQQWDINEASNPQTGQKWVLVTISSPLGSYVSFIELDAARQIGRMLIDQAEKSSKPTLIIPPPGTIIGGPNGNRPH